MQALYELVLLLILSGVGGKYCKIAVVAVVPITPHAVTPFAVRLPPVNPVLKVTLTLELSEVAETITAFAGVVQRKDAIGACVVVGVPAMALKVFVVPMQTEKSPPAVPMPATEAGSVLAYRIAVLAVLIEQGVTDFTDKVSLMKQPTKVTTTAVSFTPKGLRCVIVALVPLFIYQL